MTLNALSQLKFTIETLTCDDLPQQKLEMLTLVETMMLLYPENGSNGNGHHQRLSPREREVMNMILSGRRLKEIAATLDISVKTVTTHRSRLLRKLGVEDNLGLYRYGIRNGLISV
jgi:DNA-binding CsgD family transcriptional regulator